MAMSPSSSPRIACEMTVFPLPGGPYTNSEWLALTAGPIWSRTVSLITKCENARPTRSRVAARGAATPKSRMYRWYCPTGTGALPT